ncbi:MAG: choice-of-anchor E domain-containing protein [Pseudomonadota bacterium]
MKTLLFSAAAVALSFGYASAVTGTLDETDTGSFGPSPTELSSATIAIDGYGGSGTLTHVEIEVVGSIVNSTIDLTNNGAGPELFEASTNITFLIGGDVTFAPSTFQASGGTGIQSLNAGESGSFNVSGSNSLTEVFSSGLALFLSPFDIESSTLTGLSLVGGGGNLANSQTTNAQVDVTVRYFIADTPPPPPIPLPAGLPLLLTALGGLTFIGWRGRKA